MANFFKKHWPPFFLIVIEVFLFIANYKTGTFFLGWDNLFPEMNFLENFQRSFFSVWQEYRGLGLLDGMSFAANLPHYIFLFLLSFFLPLNLLRYFFIFFMHFLGGIGIYFLILELTSNNSRIKWAAFFGALFYLLNIGTIQMFFVPYEVFTVHFAFLPLLTLFLIKYLKQPTKKRLFCFMALSVLSAPQAHVPTLFIVYLIALFVMLFFHLIYTGKKGLAQIAAVVIVTFCANSFWGFPYAYSVLSNVQAVSNSKINQMSTEEIYLRNKAFGDLTSVISMKGFGLNFVDNEALGRDFMMKPWRIHIQQPVFSAIAFLFFVLIALGLFTSVKSREKLFYPFAVMFLVTFLMLADDAPIIGGFAFYLRRYIPYFDQIFRFTFTKFFILYAFTSAIFLGLGVSVLMYQVTRFKNLGRILLVILFLALVYYSFPVWRGNFLYPAQRLEIPKEYFTLVDFFKAQNHNSRVALIPQTSFWGWTYTNWGYQGSGFLWYGIPQASLDGAFYPWSRENENYYWELSQAFFRKDKTLFENVLEKYQINWIVIDYSLQNPFSSNVGYKDQIQEVIGKSDKLRMVKSFGSLQVYSVNLASNLQNFIFISQNLPVVNPSYQWGDLDQGYIENGNYISMPASKVSASDNYPADSYYPFRSLFTGKEQTDLAFAVEDKGDYFSFKSNIPQEMANGKLFIPLLSQDEKSNPTVFLDDKLIEFDIVDNISTEISLHNLTRGILEVRVPKNKEYSELLDPVTLNLMPKICNQLNQGVYTHDKVTEAGKNLLKITSIGSDNCLTFNFPNLEQKLGYLVTVDSAHVEGKSLLFAVINQTSQRTDLEVNLPKNLISAKSYFVIPPMEYDGSGYTFYFDNVSFGRIKTINNLGKITINAIPYQFMKSLRVIRGQLNVQPKNSLISIKTEHPNPSIYFVDVPLSTGQSSTLVLSQSFDPGWEAWVYPGELPLRRLNQHVLVNNWENGWVLRPNSKGTVIIFYWPQLLEWGGFILLVGTFLYILTKDR